MKISRTVSLALCIAVFGLSSSVTLAEETGNDSKGHDQQKVAASGEVLAKACAACHGEKGISISDEFPSLAGQYRSYLVHVLKEYRSGKRQNAVMQGFVTNLTDDEIDNLARFYAAQEGLADV